MSRIRDSRHGVLRATLAFAAIEPQTRELRLLHRWLDSWRGIGDLVAGMARQGYDMQLTGYDGRGWRATFYVSGMEHSATSARGSGSRLRRGGRHRGRRGRC